MSPVGRSPWLRYAALICAFVCAFVGAFVRGQGHATSSPKAPAKAASAVLAAPSHPTLPAGAVKAPAPSPFSRLAALRLCHVNTRECLTTQLYDAAGKVDEATAAKLDQLLGDSRDDEHEVRAIDRRLLQLVFRAAYHFQVGSIEIVSGYRKPRRKREGPHGAGTAVDFKLPAVPAATLASYVRKSPRVGVGVYTHPRTQYVHLDVRELSYHWIDASPPNRTWRERPLHSPGLGKLDATYTPASDWPEEVLTMLGELDVRSSP